MKKYLCLLLALCMLLSLLAGCGKDDAEETTEATTDAVAEETVGETTESGMISADETVETEGDDTDKGLFDYPMFGTTANTGPVVGYEFYLPTGFSYMGASDAYTDMYSDENSTGFVSVTETELPASLFTMTESEFVDYWGGTVDAGSMSLCDYRMITVDGWDALYAEYTCTLSGTAVRYFSYFIDSDVDYLFMFIDTTSDDSWALEFLESASTIQLVTQNETIVADTEELTLFDLGCGVEMYASSDLYLSSIDGYTACLDSSYCAVMFLEEPKASLDSDIVYLIDYANEITEMYQLNACSYDFYGNVVTGYLTEGTDGTVYYVYVTMKETEDSFWLIQAFMPVQDTVAMCNDVAQWLSTFGETAVTAEDRVYFVPNSDWNSGNIYYAAYFFDSKGVNAPVWSELAYSGYSYSVAIPEGYDNVIFCRMDAYFGLMDWDYRLNQTSDLPLAGVEGKIYISIEGIENGDLGVWQNR